MKTFLLTEAEGHAKFRRSGARFPVQRVLPFSVTLVSEADVPSFPGAPGSSTVCDGEPPLFCHRTSAPQELMALQRIARYRAGDAEVFGRLEGDSLARLTAPPWEGGREAGIRDAL